MPPENESHPTLVIDRLAYGGYGVGRHEGRVIFVPFGLPGDTLRVSIFKDQKRYAYAAIQEIVSPSPDRVAAPCRHFFTCGGCQWQHLPYEKQLYWKQEILKETLERLGRIKEPPLLPIIPSPKVWHYRNRIQLNVGDKGASPKGEIGFYRADGEGVVAIEECPIADERINATLKSINPREIRKRGWQVELMVDEEEGSVRLETGKGAFSQVNSEQNQNLVSAVVGLMAVREGEEVLELFAGNGNFSFPLAAQGAKVTAVEQSPGEAISVSQVPRHEVRFIYNRVEKVMRDLVRQKRKFDSLLLDPPRKGAKLILSEIVSLAPRKIVYVSCFPPTLARDLQFLTRHGYRLEKIQPIDMFPQTYHIESVSLLQKN